MKKCLSFFLLLAVFCAALGSACGSETFQWGGLRYTVLEDGTAEITGYDREDSDLLIPQSVNGVPVSKIGSTAFQGNQTLTSLTVMDGVTEIGFAAFAGCENLAYCDLHLGLTEIGSDAFEDCKSLKGIPVPDGVLHIGSGAFNGCSSLKAIVLPETVTSVGDSAFIGCDDLMHVYIPESVAEIGSSPLTFCRKAVMIVRPGSFAEQYCRENEIPYVCSEDVIPDETVQEVDGEWTIVYAYGEDVRDSGSTFTFADGRMTMRMGDDSQSASFTVNGQFLKIAEDGQQAQMEFFRTGNVMTILFEGQTAFILVK